MSLPVGKLPPDLLERLLAGAPIDDPRVLLGPGIGLDCAVVEVENSLLVFKSDPITFVTDEIGQYLVQVNANDIATTGATPRWLLITLLLPEGRTTARLAEQIMEQIYTACREMQVSVIGGHTEITHGLDRPMVIGTLVGEVEPGKLITPKGAHPGERVLLTKGVPIEGTSILAREFPERLRPLLSAEELRRASNFLFDPGIAVLPDARAALQAGRVTAMHDPTESGVAAALWELAKASGCSLEIDPKLVPVPDLSARICTAFGIDPLATIASGALLLTAPAEDAKRIRSALGKAGISCVDIGQEGPGPVSVYHRENGRRALWPYPERDGVASVFDAEWNEAGLPR